MQVLVLMDSLLDRFPEEYDKLPIEALDQSLKSNHKHRVKLINFYEAIAQKRLVARKNVTKNAVAKNNSTV